jgi:NAD(P)-dependent dehydrogenase (short-subunit alcohol dehydrogenase family)
MKTILVTGGNRGIGLEICRQLNDLGHTVILGSRDFEKGKLAARSLGKNVLVAQLDVTLDHNIQSVSELISDKFGSLDVLINNAGLGSSFKAGKTSGLSRAKDFLENNVYGVWQMSKVIAPALRKAGIVHQKDNAETISLGDVRILMETNFYGAWRMIQVFIPLLAKSGDGRIINISSGLGELNSLTGAYPGYSLSKASLNAMTIMFSNELKEKNIKVNAMCPGWVRTDMGGPNAPRDVGQGADTAVWLATEKEIPTGKFFRDRKEIPW